MDININTDPNDAEQAIEHTSNEAMATGILFSFVMVVLLGFWSENMAMGIMKPSTYELESIGIGIHESKRTDTSGFCTAFGYNSAEDAGDASPWHLREMTGRERRITHREKRENKSGKSDGGGGEPSRQRSALFCDDGDKRLDEINSRVDDKSMEREIGKKDESKGWFLSGKMGHLIAEGKAPKRVQCGGCKKQGHRYVGIFNCPEKWSRNGKHYHMKRSGYYGHDDGEEADCDVAIDIEVIDLLDIKECDVESSDLFQFDIEGIDLSGAASNNNWHGLKEYYRMFAVMFCKTSCFG
eukprot:39518_1